MFMEAGFNKAEGQALKDDFAEIGKVYGRLQFSDEVMTAFDHWYMNGQGPKPTHPKLKNYNTRRPAHLLKLCKVACINTNTDMIINLDNYHQAMNWMVEAENSIPDIFKEMASGGDEKVMEEVWHFLFQYKARFDKFAPQSMLYRFVATKVPAYSIENLLLMMEKSGMLTTEAVKGEGLVYKPLDRGGLF